VTHYRYGDIVNDDLLQIFAFCIFRNFVCIINYGYLFHDKSRGINKWETDR